MLMEALPDLNWAGFYFLRNGRLVLGPFQGRPGGLFFCAMPNWTSMAGTSSPLSLLQFSDDPVIFLFIQPVPLHDHKIRDQDRRNRNDYHARTEHKALP